MYDFIIMISVAAIIHCQWLDCNCLSEVMHLQWTNETMLNDIAQMKETIQLLEGNVAFKLIQWMQIRVGIKCDEQIIVAGS